MVRQVISVHVGQAGIQVGRNMWDILCSEHGIDCDGNVVENDQQVKNVMFVESNTGKWVPRSIFMDSEPIVVDTVVREGKFKNLFAQEFALSGLKDCADVYALGAHEIPKTFIHPETLIAIRRSIEQCDYLHGFSTFTSSSGGTGSGYGTVILQSLSEFVPFVTVHNHVIQPSLNITTNVTGYYNSVLAIANQQDYGHVKFQYDNETLYNLLHPIFREGFSGNYCDINHIMACVPSCTAMSLHDAGELNMDFDQLQTNLVPFPVLNWISPSFVPLISKSQESTTYSIHGLVAEAFLNHHEMCTLDTRTGSYMSCCLLFRGNVNNKSIYEACSDLKTSLKVPFVNWVPTGLKVGISNTSLGHSKIHPKFGNTTFNLLKLSNHTGMPDITTHIVDKFRKLFEKRAFIHPYITSGMEEGEFMDASEKVSHLQQYMTSLEKHSTEDQ